MRRALGLRAAAFAAGRFAFPAGFFFVAIGSSRVILATFNRSRAER
jgi:hypothetical protein